MPAPGPIQRCAHAPHPTLSLCSASEPPRRGPSNPPAVSPPWQTRCGCGCCSAAAAQCGSPPRPRPAVHLALPPPAWQWRRQPGGAAGCTAPAHPHPPAKTGAHERICRCMWAEGRREGGQVGGGTAASRQALDRSRGPWNADAGKQEGLHGARGKQC